MQRPSLFVRPSRRAPRALAVAVALATAVVPAGVSHAAKKSTANASTTHVRTGLESIEKQVKEFALPNGLRFMVVERHQAPVFSFQTVVDEMHIHNLAVDPARQGRGLGRRLLELSLAVGARRGAQRALLEVRQSNWSAQRLYRSLGFQGVAVRRGYYAHPAEDALLLEKRDLSAAARGSA